MVAALCKEMAVQKDFLGGENVSTIYFGGGTPSLLSLGDCKLLADAMHQNFKIDPDAEITLEANPDDISTEKLMGWKVLGINRLSMGVQSFFEEELQWMNRAHNQQQAIDSLKLAIEHFENITIDLIYGSPLLTDEMWKQNVQRAIDFGIPHLSCYALTVEEKTPLHKHIYQKQKLPVDGDKQAHQFLLLMGWLRDAGYEHYEVSNFAKPGFRSRHNSSYWKGAHYLGLGPSAHSYDGVSRHWNISNNQKYIYSINNDIVPSEKEILSETDRLNEYIMISLRTKEGLDLELIGEKWGVEMAGAIKKELLIQVGHILVRQQGSRFCLTNEGMLQADGIAASLFSIL
jgi:oxygen-independent coproporphyrinogen-3 oxidase